MPAPKSSVDMATKLGAKFETKDKKWHAVLSKRGRAVPLVTIVADTKDEAALGFIAYLQKGKT